MNIAGLKLKTHYLDLGTAKDVGRVSPQPKTHNLGLGRLAK